MKVAQDSKYKLIFSVFTHPQLGVMIHPYVVAYTSHQTLSLTYQKVFSGNASYYTRLSSDQLAQIATLDDVIYPSIDPMIFEVRFPNTDIKGKVVNL